MSDEVTCPFDGDFCDLKKKRLDEWREHCLHNPQPYYTNVSARDMFADCPIKHVPERKDSCVRFSRYLFIVDKVMAGVDESVRKILAQQNAQR